MPDQPLIFSKLVSSIVGPSGPVIRPDYTKELDYEAELAVVIGTTARDVAPERALDHVFGYAVMDDVSARDLQRSEPQWVRAKGDDTFGPFGPWVTTADEVPDPQALLVRSWVNGEPRQDSTTADMIFTVAVLVSWCSRNFTLAPGDVIATGTPPGVGNGRTPPVFLQPGDRVRIEVERLGAIEHADPMTPEESLMRVLALTGLSLPRGVLGPETWALAARPLGRGRARRPIRRSWPGRPRRPTGPSCADRWRPRCCAPAGARPRRTPTPSTSCSSGPPTRTRTRRWRGRSRCGRPPSWRRPARAPRARLRAAEAGIAQGGPDAAIAATSAAGAIAADLLDLDPEDFAIEIAEYVEAGSRPEDIEMLARATGDPEIRAWARAAVASTEAPDAPEAEAAVRHLAAGPPAGRSVGGPDLGADDPRAHLRGDRALARRGDGLRAAAAPARRGLIRARRDPRPDARDRPPAGRRLRPAALPRAATIR